jgi:hypothetical protein
MLPNEGGRIVDRTAHPFVFCLNELYGIYSQDKEILETAQVIFTVYLTTLSVSHPL